MLKSSSYPYYTSNYKDFYLLNNPYGFHFNGKENDQEIYGSGNSYDYGERMYDPRLGRIPSIDPLRKRFPNESNYMYCSNNPIFYTDNNGEQKITFIEVTDKKGNKSIVKIVDENKVRNVRVPSTVFGIPTHDYNDVDYDLMEFIHVDEKTGKTTTTGEILTRPTKDGIQKFIDSFKEKEGTKEGGIPLSASEEFNSAESQYLGDAKFKEAPINVEALMVLRGGAEYNTSITLTGQVTQVKEILIKIEKTKGALGGFDVGTGSGEVINSVTDAAKPKILKPGADSCTYCHAVTPANSMQTQAEGGKHLGKTKTKTVQPQTDTE